MALAICSQDGTDTLMVMVVVTYLIVLFASLRDPDIAARFRAWMTFEDPFGFQFWSHRRIITLNVILIGIIVLLVAAC